MPETFQGAPSWYGGDAGTLKQLIDEVNKVSKRPYEPYKGRRIASRTPVHGLASGLAFQGAGLTNYDMNQMRRQAQQAANRTTNVNTSNTVLPYIQEATRSPVQGLHEYMNPYQAHVINNMADLVNRNLQENILPSIRGRILASGSKWGRGRESLEQRALRDANESLARESGNFLHQGYGQALQTRLSNQQANLQGGLGLGSAQARDAEQQLQAAQGLGNLATQEQAGFLRGADVLNQLGTQEQAQEQANKNLAYQDFVNQRDYPMRNLAFASEQTRGLQPTVTSSFAPSAPITPFQPSPWTMGAGLMGTAAGMMNPNDPNQQQRRLYAKGGRVKGYAHGGNPIQDGVQDAGDNEDINALTNYAQGFEQPNVNPQSSALTNFGLGLMAHAQPTALTSPSGVYTNPEGGSLKAFGKAGIGAMNEYQNQLNNMDKRTRSAADIHQIINRTRQWQQQQQFAREQFEAQKANQMAHLNLQRERFNFDKQKEGKSKGPEIIKGPNGESYQAIIDQETGQIKAVPIEGMQHKINTKEYDNELKKASDGATSANEALAYLDQMERLAPDIGSTGPISGNLPDYVSTLGGIRGDLGKRQTFTAASNQLLSAILKTQKGAQSDADLAVLSTTTPGVNKTEKANQIMIQYGKELANRAIEYDQFLSNAKEEGKSLSEAKKEWKDYVNSNSILGEKQKPQSSGMQENPFMGRNPEELLARKAELEASLGMK